MQADNLFRTLFQYSPWNVYFVRQALSCKSGTLFKLSTEVEWDVGFEPGCGSRRLLAYHRFPEQWLTKLCPVCDWSTRAVNHTPRRAIIDTLDGWLPFWWTANYNIKSARRKSNFKVHCCESVCKCSCSLEVRWTLSWSQFPNKGIKPGLPVSLMQI